MKSLFLFGCLVCLLGFSSCSRHTTNIGSVLHLQSVSSLTKNHTAIPGQACSNNSMAARYDSSRLSEMKLVTDTLTMTSTGHHHEQKAENRILAHLKKQTIPNAIRIVNEVSNSHMAVPALFASATTHEEPHINKIGFILIGAGIVAFFLKLLLVVAIILVALGIIILFAPLLRKRKY